MMTLGLPYACMLMNRYLWSVQFRNRALAGQKQLSNRRTTLFSVPMPRAAIADRFRGDRGGTNVTSLRRARPCSTPRGNATTT